LPDSQPKQRSQQTPQGASDAKTMVKPDGRHREQSAGAVNRNDNTSGTESLMEQVVARANMLAALGRVQQNGGAPGTDGMTVDELRAHLQSHWLRIKTELLADTYKPQAVRRVEIPKPDGGMRLLGIPSVTDRLIQQALLQVLTPIFDPTFSEFSFGFRPGRSAHDAVKLAREYIEAGYDWVVDFDLAKFFDRVNHDKLMVRISRRVEDKRVLHLIRRYLQAGVMLNGVVVATEEGTPQGGPLSPLLGNIMLDDLDKLLEERGHRFCRYADDCNIYVRSQRAGDRTMSAVRRFIEGRLGLKLNEEKSKVDRPQNRKFLGFSFFRRKGTQFRLAPKRSSVSKTGSGRSPHAAMVGAWSAAFARSRRTSAAGCSTSGSLARRASIGTSKAGPCADCGFASGNNGNALGLDCVNFGRWAYRSGFVLSTP